MRAGDSESIRIRCCGKEEVFMLLDIPNEASQVVADQALFGDRVMMMDF